MIFLTSDQHYGHANIIKYSSRPFKDVEEMNHQLIARHNAVVSPDDTVWHLGDFALNEKLVPLILPALHGKHYLVSGNHDRCHLCHKSGAKAVKRYLRYDFLEVHQEIKLEEFLLNHMPYIGDSKNEPRYPEWRPVDKGQWLLHGHIHELWKVNGRMINVGVDQWNYAPVSIDEVRKLIS